MSKFVETTRTNKKEILKSPDHYVAIPVTVSAAGVTANGEGKKIVAAGTIMGGGFLTNTATKAIKANTAGAEGVLFYDVDVTYGDAPGAVIIHGFIDLNKLPEAPDALALPVLKQITFIK